MYQVRQVIHRMRLGETDRAIARAGLMGRRKAAAVRQAAAAAGWLDPAVVLPDDAELARQLIRVWRRAISGRSDPLAARRYPGHDHSRSAQAQAWLYGQLFGGASLYR